MPTCQNIRVSHQAIGNWGNAMNLRPYQQDAVDSAVAIHPDNEGLLIGAAHNAHIKQKAKGAIKKGAADIVICGNPTFVCEMKRQDHTKSRWQDGQLEFLEYSLKNGAFVCIALGYESALEAVKDWIKKAP